MPEFTLGQSGQKWSEVDIEENKAPVEAPRGIFAARVDEKGRLKLPVNFQAFLNGSGGGNVFITSLDYTTGRIYPLALWKQNEEILNAAAADSDTAEDISFVANKLGADAEMDNQGRVLVPTDLRRELNMEGQPVWLECFQGGINIYNEKVYQEREARSRQNLADKLKAFKAKGLK